MALQLSAQEPTLAESLANGRHRAGLTVEQAAKRAGRTPNKWRRWESGKRECLASECPPVAEALGMTLEAFFSPEVGITGKPI